MIRRSFLGAALLTLAPFARLLAACKPALTGRDALEATLKAAHGKQYKDIPWLVWTESELTMTTRGQSEHIQRWRCVDWPSSFNRLYLQYKAGPGLYYAECDAVNPFLGCFHYDGAHEETQFLFIKLWDLKDWIAHNQQRWHAAPSSYIILG